MAEPLHSLILDALQASLFESDGAPLLMGKNSPGLFANTKAGKQAALKAKEDGLLRVVRTEPKGKATVEYCAVSEKGLNLLLSERRPRTVLEAILRAVEACQCKINEWVCGVETNKNFLDRLRATTEKALNQLDSPAPFPSPSEANGKPLSDELAVLLLGQLTEWQRGGHLEDMPLPLLFRRIKEVAPHMTIGQFHDAVRGLREARAVHLHPWTGPLYEIPEPALGLLYGHEIGYYASAA